MEVETLTQAQALGGTAGSGSATAEQDDNPTVPVRRKVSRKVKLEGGQILQAADGAIDIGLRAARRKLEHNGERAYLGALLRDLGRWAQRTEPGLELAQFVVDVQRVGRTLDLRRQLADRRTDAFRRALGEARSVAVGDVDMDDGGDGAGDGEDPTATETSRVAPQLDEDIDLADIKPVPLTPKPKTAAAKLDGTNAADADNVQPEASPQALAPVSSNDGGARVAQQLDEDIDLADGISAPVTPVTKNNKAAQAKITTEEDEQYDYDMEILREFEMGE